VRPLIGRWCNTEDSGDDLTGAYSVAFHRTDAASDCPVLPAGSFAADGAKATLTTGDGVFSQCLSIPADAHTSTEVFQLLATSGGIPAKFSVLDSTGKKVCDRTATRSANCARRDVTATADSAGCTRTVAVKVGGPSVKGTHDVPGTLNCHRVTTGAATDVIHLDVRDALGTADIAVVGGGRAPHRSHGRVGGEQGEQGGRRLTG